MTSSNKGSKDERNDDNDMIIRRLYDNKHDDYEDYNDDNDDERDDNDDESDDKDNNNDDGIPPNRWPRAFIWEPPDPPVATLLRLLPRLLEEGSGGAPGGSF